MSKISDKVIKFITEGAKNWKAELVARGKTLAEVKIPTDIFQGDSLSSLLFVIAMMPLDYIHRKCPGGYKITKNNNHIMYIDDIKLFAKKEKELENLIQIIAALCKSRSPMWFDY